MYSNDFALLESPEGNSGGGFGGGYIATDGYGGETAVPISAPMPVLIDDTAPTAPSLVAPTPEMSNCALVGLCNATPVFTPPTPTETATPIADAVTLDLPPAEENFFDKMQAFFKANSWLLWLILGAIIYLNRDKIF